MFPKDGFSLIKILKIEKDRIIKGIREDDGKIVKRL